MSESTPFKFDDDLNDEAREDETEFSKHRHAQLLGLDRRLVTAMALFLNIILAITLAAFALSSTYSCSQKPHDGENFGSPFDPDKINEAVLMPVQYGWEYYADKVEDMDAVDRHWDALNPDLGFVSLPRDELARGGFHPGGDDPSDPNKGLHALQAYHSMHCLKVIRHTMLQLVRGDELDVRFGHSMHCLGSLLREVICTADNSLPIDIPGNDYASYQYARKCRNWEALRQWTGKRTSCMVTNAEGILDAEHPAWENCSRTDGVLVPTLPKVL